jgi:hypothetical protein
MGLRFSNKLVAELYQPFWAAWPHWLARTESAGSPGCSPLAGRPRRGRNLRAMPAADPALREALCGLSIHAHPSLRATGSHHTQGCHQRGGAPW